MNRIISGVERAGPSDLPKDFVDQWNSKVVTQNICKIVQKDEVRSYGRRSIFNEQGTSLERQAEETSLCAERVFGKSVTKQYSDHGVSGTTMVGRHGLIKAIADAEKGEYSVLIVEDADRIARDIAILATVFKRLTKAGVQIYSIRKGGQIVSSDIAMSGFYSAEQLATLKYRAAKGRELGHALGRVMGPASYGFEAGAKRGERVVTEALRETIQWIFDRRAEGMSLRAIARSLNERKIPTKRGFLWRSQSVKSVLSNERYIGWNAFGKTSTTYDPDLGMSVQVKKDTAEWKLNRIADWIVVEQEQFEAVQAMRKRDADKAGTSTRTREAFLSGKAVCHACGSPMRSKFREIGKDSVPHIVCRLALTHECEERAAYRQSAVKKVVYESVQEILSHERLDADYVAIFNRQRDIVAKELEDRRKRLVSIAEGLDKQIEQTWDERFIKGMSTERVAARRQGWEAELAKVREDVEALPRPPTRARINVDKVNTLRNAFVTLMADQPLLTDSVGRELHSAAVAAAKQVVSKISCFPFPCSKTMRVDIELQTSGLFDDPDGVGQVGFETSKFSVVVHDDVKGAGRRLQVEGLRKLLAEGTYRASDAEFRAVYPFVPESARAWAAKRGADEREMIEILFHCLRTGVREQHLAILGKRMHTTWKAYVSKILVEGGWERMCERLKVDHPRTFAEFQPDYFGCFWRNREGDNAYARRKWLEKKAAKEAASQASIAAGETGAG